MIGQAGVYWPFKSLLEGPGITLVETANSITIESTGTATGGTGDMTKAEYATNGQHGVVDKALTANTVTGTVAHAQLADSVPWNGITGAPASFPSDWSVITNKPNLFPPLPHAPQHAPTGSDPIPLAGTAAAGQLAQLSGNSTDYVGGDNACHPMSQFVPTGTVLSFAGPTAPTGFLICDGSAVSRTTFSALYTALGGASSPWGQGDGTSTFNVPDMRGRGPIGAGQGSGLTNRILAALGGEENHILSVAELASHGHGASVSDPGHTHRIYFIKGGDTVYGTGLGDAGQNAGSDWCATTNTTGIQVGIAANGGNAGHNNLQPFVVLQYIIKI